MRPQNVSSERYLLGYSGMNEETTLDRPFKFSKYYDYKKMQNYINRIRYRDPIGMPSYYNTNGHMTEFQWVHDSCSHRNMTRWPHDSLMNTKIATRGQYESESS